MDGVRASPGKIVDAVERRIDKTMDGIRAMPGKTVDAVEKKFDELKATMEANKAANKAERDAHHAELKSMHTLAKSRGSGVGKAMVAHIEQFAKEQGVKRISLETGATEPFKPARLLYKSLGYQDCEAFGDYVLSQDNTCMTKLI